MSEKMELRKYKMAGKQIYSLCVSGTILEFLSKVTLQTSVL